MRIPPERNYTVIDVARAFSIAAHTAVGQKRKYTNDEYYKHPEEVLQILLSYYEPSTALQVATLLHDVIEDTATKREDIAMVFGQEVASYVVEVSDVSKPEDGKRGIRKAIDREHLGKASLDAKCLKCADLIHNSESIVDHAPGFAKVYLEEKFLILADFYNTMNGLRIYRKAMRVCQESFRLVYPDINDYQLVISRFMEKKSELFKDIFNGVKR